MTFRFLFSRSIFKKQHVCLHDCIGSEFILALTIHSYGQFFVYPWGYTTDEDPANIDQLVRPSHAAAIVKNDVMRSFNNVSKCTLAFALATEKYRLISFVDVYRLLKKCNLTLSGRPK